MNARRAASCTAMLLVAGGILAGTYLTCLRWRGITHVATVVLPHGRAIEISTEDVLEGAPPLYYRVKHSHDEWRFFDARMDWPNTLRFEALAAEGGHLVGLVEASCPDVVLVLCDFAHGIYWPPPLGKPVTSREASDLVRRLQAEHPDRVLRRP